MFFYWLCLEIKHTKSYYTRCNKNKYTMNIKQLNKLISERKALANKQYKARCELKELEGIINQHEIILKESGNPPSQEFIKDQNERIDKKCMLLLNIQENNKNLIHLDESIKAARKLLEWSSIINSQKLRKHIELVIEDVNELQASYQLDIAVLDDGLRKALTTLHLVVKKLKEWFVYFQKRSHIALLFSLQNYWK